MLKRDCDGASRRSLKRISEKSVSEKAFRQINEGQVFGSGSSDDSSVVRSNTSENNPRVRNSSDPERTRSAAFKPFDAGRERRALASRLGEENGRFSYNTEGSFPRVSHLSNRKKTQTIAVQWNCDRRPVVL